MFEDKAVNLGDLIRTDTPLDHVALIYHASDGVESSYRFGDLEDAIARLTAALLQRGLPPGSCVALLGRNSPEYLVACMAIMRAGLVAVPLNYRQSQDILAHCLRDAEVQLIFTDGQFSLPPNEIETLALGEDLDAGGDTPGATDPDQTAMILYTSGSTGFPKGVELSHRSQLFNLTSRERFRNDMRTHIISVAAPMYHMNALMMLQQSLYMGSCVVLFEEFDARAILEAIPRHGITWLSGVPTMYALMMEHQDLLEANDFGTVRQIILASAPLTPNLFAKVKAHFPNAMLVNGYGTTEHGPAAFAPHPDGLATPELSVGYPNPMAEVRLTGQGYPANTGVLEVRSPGNMSGYRNLPDVTAERLKDNWYYTGDIFRRDEEGFFYFVGRADDMFVCNGENVYPLQIEAVLERHKDVAQACVVPAEDPIRGQAPIAFVTTHGAAFDEAEIQEFYRQNSRKVDYPRRVIRVDTMPLASTNKIDRALLQSRAAGLEITAPKSQLTGEVTK